MNLLLDTSYVFSLAGEKDLSAAEAALFVAPPGRLVVSVVSIWEIRLKWRSVHRDGSRKGPISPAQAIGILDDERIERLVLTEAHAAANLEQGLDHADPFDELLMVQAQVEGMKLLTRDDKLKSHPCAFAL